MMGPVSTHGSVGQTLVKGVIMTLPANGISVKAGGEIQNLNLTGGIVTHGDKVVSLEIEGKVSDISIKNDITANGLDSIGAAISEGGQSPLREVIVQSKQGIAVRINKQGKLLDQRGLIAKGAKGQIVKE